MPELPDVEIWKRYVDATSLHRTIADVMVRQELVEDSAPQTIRDHLGGAEFSETRRHGNISSSTSTMTGGSGCISA